MIGSISQSGNSSVNAHPPFGPSLWSTHSRTSTSTSSSLGSPSSLKPKRLSPEKRLNIALAYLRQGRLGPIDLLAHALDPSIPENDRYRTSLYKEGGRLGEVLDMVREDSRGRERLELWMKQHAVELTCTIVEQEMDAVKSALHMKLEDVTPDYISRWTVEATSGVIVQECAPILHRLLIRAAQTDKAKAKNKNKVPDTVRAPTNLTSTLSAHELCLAW